MTSAGDVGFHGSKIKSPNDGKLGLCPGVPVHRGNNHCTPFFMNLCLAVEHFWVFCIGSCEPVHEDRTQTGERGSRLCTPTRGALLSGRYPIHIGRYSFIYFIILTSFGIFYFLQII